MTLRINHTMALLVALVINGGCPSPKVEPGPLRVYQKERDTDQDELAFWRGRGDLISTPKAQPAQALELTALKRLRLKNGLRVVMMPEARLPLVQVQLVLRAGGIDDPSGKTGLSEFTAGMLRQGTQRMGADKLSETVDASGASLSAGSGYELTKVVCSGRKHSIGLCLQLVADLVIRPTFVEKEMAEIRDRLLSAIKQTRDDPESLAAAHFDNLLYGDGHPAGRPLSEATVRKITRQDLIGFHRRHFVPGAAILGISGDIDPMRLEGLIRKNFRRWPKRPPVVRKIAPVKDPQSGLKVLLIDKPDLSQSFFALGHSGIRLTHPDRDAVEVMNYVLGGGGFSSRLMEVVRAKGGKTYGISSAFFQATDDGAFLVESFTRNRELVPTLKLVLKELARLSSAPPTRVEIAAAKGKIAGGYPIRLKTSAALVAQLIQAQIRGLPDSHVVEFPLRVDRLTRGQVVQAARKHVRPNRLVATVVGKASEVAPQLKEAKIPFETISYLDPISARARKELASTVQVSISEQERRRARAVLDRALRIAGGRKRLATVKTLRMTGKIGEIGRYTALILLPDHMRLTLAIKPIGYAQVLAGDSAFIQVGPQRKDLPKEVVLRLKALLWREPALLPLRALAEGVRARPSMDVDVKKNRAWTGVDLFPPGMPPITAVFERRTGHLVQVRHRNRRGQLRTTELGGHKRIDGLIVPHRITALIGNRRQTVTYTKVEVNPALDRAALLGK